MKLGSGQTLTIRIEEARGSDLDNIQDARGVLEDVETDPPGDNPDGRVTFSCNVILDLDDTDQAARILRLLGVQTEAEKIGLGCVDQPCSRCGLEPCEC